jgi:hypothetical protein
LLYEEKVSEIRELETRKFEYLGRFWVDETSDKKGRYIANVIVGTLEENAK